MTAGHVVVCTLRIMHTGHIYLCMICVYLWGGSFSCHLAWETDSLSQRWSISHEWF